jgi:hypothetical protein
MMSANPEFKWRRTTVTRRDRTVISPPDDWSLIHLPTGLGVAQIIKGTSYHDRNGWNYVIRSMSEDGVLKDSITGWSENPTESRAFVEGQTFGLRYVIHKKRTKEEILGRPPRK